MPSKYIEPPQELPADLTPPVEAGAAQSPASAGADDDLETLLAQFEQATAQPQQPAPIPQEYFDLTLKTAEMHQARGLLQDATSAYQQQLAQAEFDKELKSTVAACRGDLDPEFFDDALITAWLDKRARDDQGLQQAILQRGQNPRAWQAAKQRLATEFHKYGSRFPDARLTEDTAAVAAAVRGATGGAPAEPAVNYAHMSDAEYRKSIREQFGFDPKV